MKGKLCQAVFNAQQRLTFFGRELLPGRGVYTRVVVAGHLTFPKTIQSLLNGSEETFMVTCICSLLALSVLGLQQPNQSAYSLNWRDMIVGMSWLGVTVVVVLLLMSIYSIALMLERYLTYKAAARQSREFAPKVAELLRGAQLDNALKLSQTYQRSHLAVVVNSGLQELAASTALVKPERQMRKAKRAVRRAAAMKSAELQRGLSALATVGSTAPFVGLFGTVIGIIHAFEVMGQQETAGFSAIAGGISEALVTTAFGLVVAIPAVWMFNYFSSRVRGFEVEMNNSADELIDYFLQQREGV
jgi:biopolymer transport protein ExbB/TolQ